MVQQTSLPPLTRGQWLPMTWEEFLVWSPDEGQSEWVDGEGIAYVSNSERHVGLVVLLTEVLGQYLRLFGLGRLFVDSMLLRLPVRPSGRSPDLFVVGPGDFDRIRYQWVEGPALLVVEVVSEESGARDLVEKRAEYERAGIPEYLLVEARPGRQGITLLRLGPDGRYQAAEPDLEGRVRSTALPGFWLDPAWFRQDALPEVEDLLLEIAPEAYEAWHLARFRSRRTEPDAPR